MSGILFTAWAARTFQARSKRSARVAVIRGPVCFAPGLAPSLP